MRRILLILGALFLLWSCCYAGDVYVNGYFRKDGTYVAPYHRSSPDNTVRNNYDYEGNTNPYTGELGHNHYRNNPTSEYYGSDNSGGTQTIYSNGQAYQVTPQSDGSFIVRDSSGNAYRLDGNE